MPPVPNIKQLELPAAGGQSPAFCAWYKAKGASRPWRVITTGETEAAALEAFLSASAWLVPGRYIVLAAGQHPDDPEPGTDRPVYRKGHQLSPDDAGE